MWASLNCIGLRILRSGIVYTPPVSNSRFQISRFMESSHNSTAGNPWFTSSARSNKSGDRTSGLGMKDIHQRSTGRGSGSGSGSSEKDKIDSLGRLLTRILRHMASELKLDMRADGYVRVEDLLQLSIKTAANVPLRSHTVDDVREAVRKDNKQRFGLLEHNGDLLIRANQGHTIAKTETEVFTIATGGPIFQEATDCQQLKLKACSNLYFHLKKFQFVCTGPTRRTWNQFYRRVLSA